MPRVSEFYGIVIAMYYSEHPPPHFHAFHAGAEASVIIDSGEMLERGLSRRALRLVTWWARLHTAELKGNWDKARRGVPLDKIPPLE